MPKVDEENNPFNEYDEDKQARRMKWLAVKAKVFIWYCKTTIRCQGPGRFYTGCSEDDLYVLSIDHVNGDGAYQRALLALSTHRRQKRRKTREIQNTFMTVPHNVNLASQASRKVGGSQYNDLIRRKFPPGIRVLCRNCQERVKYRAWMTSGLETVEEYYQRCPEMRRDADAKGRTSNDG